MANEPNVYMSDHQELPSLDDGIPPSKVQIHLLCVAVLAATFVLDINLPLGVAGGVPYIMVILLTLWVEDRRLPVFYAVVCSAATTIGYYWSPSGGEEWKVFSNRGLALLAIWSVAILASRWKAQVEDGALFRAEHLRDRKEIYEATIHGSQVSLNNLLNELQYVQTRIEDSPDLDSELAATLGRIVQKGAILMVRLSSVDSADPASIEASVQPDNVLEVNRLEAVSDG